jgi:hypothetical protein
MGGPRPSRVVEPRHIRHRACTLSEIKSILSASRLRCLANEETMADTGLNDNFSRGPTDMRLRASTGWLFAQAFALQLSAKTDRFLNRTSRRRRAPVVMGGNCDCLRRKAP